MLHQTCVNVRVASATSVWVNGVNMTFVCLALKMVTHSRKALYKNQAINHFNIYKHTDLVPISSSHRPQTGNIREYRRKDLLICNWGVQRISSTSVKIVPERNHIPHHRDTQRTCRLHIGKGWDHNLWGVSCEVIAPTTALLCGTQSYPSSQKLTTLHWQLKHTINLYGSCWQVVAIFPNQNTSYQKSWQQSWNFYVCDYYFDSC